MTKTLRKKHRKGARQSGQPASGLQERRIEIGLTQDELGEALEITGRHVSNLERGASPIAEEFVPALAKALKVPVRRVREWRNETPQVAAPPVEARS